MYPIILAGRWIDRAAGLDGPELEREARQRRIQAERAGSWGSKVPSNGASSDPGDPGARRPKGGLMDYQQLYALWERQNWRSHELDFSVDREQWLAAPTEAQAHNLFSLGSFYVGEERVTADLAPFVLAAPSGEVEAFLSTQLVDEMRHAVFFDRFFAEVTGLESGDMRARLEELESKMLGEPWHFLFDDSLRDVANRIKAKPDDLELFVEGIVTYHMVTEGVLAMPGQRIIIQYTEDHNLYPGFNKGFRLVEQDEHRHIAFGVRFLSDMGREDPRYMEAIRRTMAEALPLADGVLDPPWPEEEDVAQFRASREETHAFAAKALSRRMKVIGLF
jgi:ribonucleoside-diphosphate reductase beta chain